MTKQIEHAEILEAMSEAKLFVFDAETTIPALKAGAAALRNEDGGTGLTEGAGVSVSVPTPELSHAAPLENPEGYGAYDWLDELADSSSYMGDARQAWAAEIRAEVSRLHAGLLEFAQAIVDAHVLQEGEGCDFCGVCNDSDPHRTDCVMLKARALIESQPE